MLLHRQTVAKVTRKIADSGNASRTPFARSPPRTHVSTRFHTRNRATTVGCIPTPSAPTSSCHPALPSRWWPHRTHPRNVRRSSTPTPRPPGPPAAALLRALRHSRHLPRRSRRRRGDNLRHRRRLGDHPRQARGRQRGSPRASPARRGSRTPPHPRGSPMVAPAPPQTAGVGRFRRDGYW